MGLSLLIDFWISISNTSNSAVPAMKASVAALIVLCSGCGIAESKRIVLSGGYVIDVKRSEIQRVNEFGSIGGRVIPSVILRGVPQVSEIEVLPGVPTVPRQPGNPIREACSRGQSAVSQYGLASISTGPEHMRDFVGARAAESGEYWILFAPSFCERAMELHYDPSRDYFLLCGADMPEVMCVRPVVREGYAAWYYLNQDTLAHWVEIEKQVNDYLQVAVRRAD